MELVAGVKATYARAVPIRWRALMGAWGGKRRCNSGSQCERQCEQLLKLVRAHAETRCRTRAAEEEAGANDTADGTSDVCLFEACVAVLDAPDHFLTLRRTTALAHETLMEALVRSQQEGGRYDEDARRCSVWLLERLAQHMQTLHDGCPSRTTDEAQRSARARRGFQGMGF